MFTIPNTDPLMLGILWSLCADGYPFTLIRLTHVTIARNS